MTPDEEAKLVAGTALIGRTGAQDVQIRFCEEEKPVVWMAVAAYKGGRWDVAAGADPVSAILRLCERLIDGGKCNHCKRMTVFDEDFTDVGGPFDGGLCWYQWDPELKTFRRGCE